MYHALPTGATPVPLKDGKRSVAGWDFHYQGWKLDENHPTKFRSGATKDDPFPECRKGSLDGAVLEKLSLESGRMSEDDGAPDALFFLQLLLPISKTTGIEDDPRKPFYPQVAQWSNLYAIGELDLGCGENHNYI